MEKSRFVEVIIAALENEGYSVSKTTVKKANHETYDGLCVSREGDNVSPNLNIDTLYSRYVEGMREDEVIKYAIEVVTKAYEDVPEISLQDITDYERMKETLCVQLIPIEGNEEVLEETPYIKVLDLALVARLVLDSSDDSQATVLVKNQLLEKYKITKEQLFEDAANNSSEMFPINIRNIKDVLMGMIPDDVIEETPEIFEGPQLYVATNSRSMNGASIITYPDFIDKATKIMGDDFYILPSSIHEVLLVPMEAAESVDYLYSMVREVNDTQVEPCDLLSYNVYAVRNRELSIA